MRRALRRALAGSLVLAILSGAGCGSDEAGGPSRDRPPSPIGDQEDPVCGMLVREQPAPRAQVFHRDGTSFFLCSVADLLVHLSAPSPHGSVVDVFVEVIAPGEDLASADRGDHDWIGAAQATFVVGVPRRGVMGEPILAYASAEDAREAASPHAGARVLDFDDLERWWRELQSER